MHAIATVDRISCSTNMHFIATIRRSHFVSLHRAHDFELPNVRSNDVAYRISFLISVHMLAAVDRMHAFDCGRRSHVIAVVDRIACPPPCILTDVEGCIAFLPSVHVIPVVGRSHFTL